MLVSTTTLEGRPITEYMDVICAQGVLGVNVQGRRCGHAQRLRRQIEVL